MSWYNPFSWFTKKRSPVISPKTYNLTGKDWVPLAIRPTEKELVRSKEPDKKPTRVPWSSPTATKRHTRRDDSNDIAAGYAMGAMDYYSAPQESKTYNKSEGDFAGGGSTVSLSSDSSYSSSSSDSSSSSSSDSSSSSSSSE